MKSKLSSPFNQVSLFDKVLFAKHLTIMIKAGLSLRESVETIKEQTNSKKFKEILNDIIKRLDNGEALGDSLAKHPRIFSNFFVDMIRLGEESGTLEENLGHLALQLEKGYDLRKKVKAAMIYPVFILLTTLGVGATLTLFVLPKLIPLFKSFDIKLPLPTKILMGISEAFQNHGILILIGIILVSGALILISRIKKVKKFNHRLLISLPIIGPIYRNTNLIQFSRTLGVLLKSGISIITALEITANTLPNLIYQQALKETSLKVQRGESLGNYLHLHPKLFPPTVSRMVEVGEKTANLEETLLYLAEFYEKEVENATKNLSSISEPILLIIIGTLIGFVAISIIMPIYQFTSGIYL